MATDVLFVNVQSRKGYFALWVFLFIYVNIAILLLVVVARDYPLPHCLQRKLVGASRGQNLLIAGGIEVRRTLLTNDA